MVAAMVEMEVKAPTPPPGPGPGGPYHWGGGGLGNREPGSYIYVNHTVDLKLMFVFCCNPPFLGQDLNDDDSSVL